MAKRKIIGEPELIRATFHCPHLDKLVDVGIEDLHFHGYYHPGGTQDNGYSEVTISFMCECGDNHDITICNY